MEKRARRDNIKNKTDKRTKKQTKSITRKNQLENKRKQLLEPLYDALNKNKKRQLDKSKSAIKNYDIHREFEEIDRIRKNLLKNK